MEHDKRRKRDDDHAKFLKRSQDLDAKENHFEEIVKPKVEKTFATVGKLLQPGRNSKNLEKFITIN